MIDRLGRRRWPIALEVNEAHHWWHMQNMPDDLRRMRIREMGMMGEVEQARLPVEESTPQPPRSWRYRHEGAPRIFALVGVALGFLALVVPGIFALRSYRGWKDGVRAEPTFAWSMAVIGIVAIPTVLLFMLLPVVGIAFGILALLSGLVLVGPRH
jgi:hypothetical protein